MAVKVPNHTCRVCGKRYYACPPCEKHGSWRAVACSPECYKKYIEAVEAARAPVQEPKKTKPSKKAEQAPAPKEEQPVVSEEEVKENEEG